MIGKLLALGSAQFGFSYGVSNNGHLVGPDEIKEILNRAEIEGIDTLDTAMAYGQSERVLGQVGIRSWNVVTKLPPVPENINNIEAWIRDKVFNSLGLLGLENLYGLLLHDPSQLIQKNGMVIYSTLKSLKEDGIINKIGISIYDPSEFFEISKYFKLDLVQSPLNLFDRRIIESGCALKLYEQGIELHVRSIFLQGLLLMKSKERPNYFSRWNESWNEWDNWISENEFDPLKICLDFARSVKFVDRIVVGVHSAKQFEEILNALRQQEKSNFRDYPEFRNLRDGDLINPRNWQL